MSEFQSIDVVIKKKMAVESNTLVWKYLQQNERSNIDNSMMLAAAYTSLFVWDQIGTDINRARAHWLVSRVLTVLNQGELALLMANKISNVENRNIFEGDLKTGPWFGVDH